jgi:hypothetical protein
MPLPKQDKSQPVELTARVHPETLRRVQDFAQSLDSDPDYVVNGIIADWFSREPAAKKPADPKAAKTPKVVAKPAAVGGR